MAKPSKTQSNADHSPNFASDNQDHAGVPRYQMGRPLVAISISIAAAAVFYSLVMILTATELTSFVGDPLRRYFLGHPIAVAATVLFWFGIGSLVAKQLAVTSQNNLLSRIFDSHLSPSGSDSTGNVGGSDSTGNVGGSTHTDSESGLADPASPADQWLASNDAGYVAKNWLRNLASLPQATRDSVLVRRLEEILLRQSRRGSSKQLPDDLREVAARDGDSAHDSLGMVRIIVWAIPMLGFLGTVIGITQTLGGLDFTNGSAAVDNLKSGLYVAFDTTAVGLVLSVVAIFLQFPVERSEQRLLADIDQRVGSLVSSNLPSDEASDNQTVLIADLCRGVQAAVAESLDNQAKLWRDTIDTAEDQWQSVHDDNNNKLVDAFKLSLVPALIEHTETLTKSQERFAAMGSIEDRLSDNLQALRQTSESIQNGLESQDSSRKETDETMADAVRTLARAVDILSTHMSQNRRPENSIGNEQESHRVSSTNDQLADNRIGRAA